MTLDSQPEEILTVPEIARQWKVHPRTVRDWVAKGLLRPAATLPGGSYRIKRADIEEALRSQER